MPSSLPAFTAPISIRLRSPRFALHRGLAILFTAVLHLGLITALVLGDFLVVESVKPPRAATQIPLVFHPPGSFPKGGGPRPTGSTSPADAPRLMVPPPKPVVFALPPPSAENSPTQATPEPLENGGPADGLPGGPLVGDGPGDGMGGHGTGDSGLDGPGGPGSGPGTEDAPFPEGHPDIAPPVLIASSRAYPRYPELARKAGVQGSVILLVVIDAQGRVGSIEVLRAPDPRYGFDLATIEAVKQWRYRPALLGGRPVAVQASITFEFTLSR